MMWKHLHMLTFELKRGQFVISGAILQNMSCCKSLIPRGIFHKREDQEPTEKWDTYNHGNDNESIAGSIQSHETLPYELDVCQLIDTRKDNWKGRPVISGATPTR
eukprot:scaffold103527_cov117-Cyclotella_meneghiniana.AAC.1